MSGELVVIPDPEVGSLPALVYACDQMTHLLRTDPPDDIDTAIEMLSRLSAIEKYLEKHDQERAAQTPARLLEAHIGSMLKPYARVSISPPMPSTSLAVLSRSTRPGPPPRGRRPTVRLRSARRARSPVGLATSRHGAGARPAPRIGFSCAA